MVFIKYSEAKHFRYYVKTQSFNLSDLPRKLEPTTVGFSHVRQMANERTRCLCTIETEVHIIRNIRVKLELLHFAARHVDMFMYNVLKILMTMCL